MRLFREIGRLVLGLAGDLATAVVIEGLAHLSQGADALVDLLERDEDDLDEPDELVTYLQQILIAGAQVRYDPERARPWFLILGVKVIASGVSLADLVLQARARAHSENP